MSYIKFDKTQLINLEYALNREILRSNRAGSYASSTIIYCNTRKYHGYLVCPVEHLDGEKHVLLSSLDEVIIDHKTEFNLSIHKYDGDVYFPRGHKYIRDYEVNKIPRIVYRIGSNVISKENLLAENEQQILIKYTLLEAGSSLKFRLSPYLAFRNMHSLSKANLYANTKIKEVSNGIASRMYDGYPKLYMQLSKKPEYVHNPDWYYNIEYVREQERGYDFKEDLFVPGYFEVSLKQGESVIFSAGTIEAVTSQLKRKFETELNKRISRENFKSCLINSAEQFIVKNKRKTEIIAGFPWFGSWGRDTFISLPGLTLAIDDVKTCKSVIDTMIAKMKGGLFPNMGSDEHPAFNSVDAPMWFFQALQKYTDYMDDPVGVWTKYGKAMKAILRGFKNGLDYNIKLHDNGLIYAGIKGKALTWMDAVVNGIASTPRIGYPVEINVLWYNAVMFSLELAEKAGDKAFFKEWSGLPEKTKTSFVKEFWSKEKNYLADYVDGNFKDWSVRPNQVFATSVKYSPITDEMKNGVLEIVKSELLTPKGLRTLSPKNPLYKGVYEGSQEDRDNAYHQGAVWPWLLEAFCEGYLKLYKKSGINFIKNIYEGFEEEMSEHGIGSISEIYDGNPPHKPRGAISQAWSVSALLQISKMIENWE